MTLTLSPKKDPFHDQIRVGYRTGTMAEPDRWGNGARERGEVGVLAEQSEMKTLRGSLDSQGMFRGTVC